MADENMIKLYISFKDDARGWLSLHRQHFTQFVTIILAVLAASLTAFFQLKDSTLLLLIVILGPILNIVLSFVGIKVCDKFYLRYGEHQAASDKLYFAMEESEKINSRIEHTKEIFPDDSHLFTKRWLDRTKKKGKGKEKYKTSDEFAKARLTASDSSNRYIRITFGLLISANLVVASAIIITSAINVFRSLVRILVQTCG